MSTWLFGYGSLVWRPDFPFRRAAPGYVLGWARRFWQGSHDHRGVPGAPGRVVTLVREPEATCWGVAYELEPDGTEAILQALDHREKDGYERHRQNVRLMPERGTFLGGGSNERCQAELPDGEVEALLYVATPSNPAFLGEASIEDIAAQVRRARGPSGSNVEYVLELARALRAIGAHDEHVEALAEAVVEAVSS